jgi:hypothetical protein
MTCKTCQHANRQASPRHTDVGFVRCNMHEKWQFFPPQHTCNQYKPEEKKK